MSTHTFKFVEVIIQNKLVKTVILQIEPFNRSLEPVSYQPVATGNFEYAFTSTDQVHDYLHFLPAYFLRIWLATLTAQLFWINPIQVRWKKNQFE